MSEPACFEVSGTLFCLLKMNDETHNQEAQINKIPPKQCVELIKAFSTSIYRSDPPRFSMESKHFLSDTATEFLCFIASEALDLAKEGSRKEASITHSEHVFQALEKLGFPQIVPSGKKIVLEESSSIEKKRQNARVRKKRHRENAKTVANTDQVVTTGEND
eukprot:GCRY01001873.1.p1 GENE.GCRY01001873.1~~GCRY01001873.1.p1  ORF type:complete len:162 (+),score=5.30 GCRY01001873.1:204-689(+)